MSKVSYETVLENLFDGVYFVDRDRRITIWNRGAERITGFEKADVIGKCCADNILRHIDADGRELCESGCPLSATLADGEIRESNIFLHHHQGHRVPVSVRISPVRDDQGEVIGGIEVFSDNSSSVKLLQELELLKQEAFLDGLTGIGNRRYANLALQTRIFDLETHGIGFGVIFLDIDHFKRFNDTYGHRTGDDVLVMVAKSVSGLLRSSDIFARWGGEEFVVLLPRVNTMLLNGVAERIRTFIEESFIMSGEEKISVTASIGVTLGKPGDTVDSVMERVDRMMYTSKESGRNRVTVG